MNGMGWRILAFLGAIATVGIFAACPIFHGVTAPWFVLLIVIAMLGILVVITAGLLWFAVRGAR